MILSIILMIVVTLLFVTATHITNGGGLADESDTRTSRLAFLKKVSEENWIFAIFVGLVIGAINYFTPHITTVLWLAPVFLAIMIAYYIYLMYWWHHAGGDWREVIVFLLLAIAPYFTMKATAMATTALWANVFWTSVLAVLPKLILVATIGYYIIDALYLNYDENCTIADTEIGEVADAAEAKAARYHGLGVLAIALTTIAIILLLAGIKWGSISIPKPSRVNAEDQAVEPTKQTEVVEVVDKTATTPVSWSAFYNLALQKDDDPENDFNFGYNPRVFHEDWEKSEDAPKLFDTDFRERMRGTKEKGADVALGVAAMAWTDANVGTRYLGEFYETCKNDWAKTINSTVRTFMANEELYQNTLDAFFKFLDTATVEVREASDMDDQMYMNPYTVDHVPDVIVMKTEDHTGKFLVYTFKIKDKNIDVAYRIDCGYQPTNVEKVMKITPTTKPTGGGDTPTDKPSGGGNKPTPPGGGGDKPTPPGGGDEPSDGNGKKDPTQGTQGDLVKPNDNPGPGPDTNNGKGAKESTEDLPTNSNHETYREYKEDVEELKETNDKQLEGGDSNKPTEETPKNTTVDNNGSKGIGDGGIDVPTPVVTPRAEDSNTGKPITNNPSNPAGEWEGPPD